MKLYVLCIDLNLVPNILDEFYLIVELLTVQERSSKLTTIAKSTTPTYLNNVHNCVYFACELLLQEASLLDNLDQVALDLLVDNPRIGLFSPTLKVLVTEARINRSSQSRRQSSNASSAEVDAPLESVRFMPETDNNRNFPTDRDFQVSFFKFNFWECIIHV